MEKLDINESNLKEKSVEFSIEEKLLLKDKNTILSSIDNKVFMSDYEDKDKEILANIYNGSCSSCYTSLPAQSLVDAKKGSSLITCPSCSIFLYFDEDN
jgi:predicted  nucleic acid-binding Zn-ribbon protein